MTSRVHDRLACSDERGFTLIEILVVILIIGILAAIAIPSFLSQRGKATDSTAKEVARSAAQAAETYATDHSGNYGSISPAVLREYEAAIQTSASTNNAWLSEAKEAEGGKGFVVKAVAPNTGDTFTWTKKENGEVLRTCKAETSNTAGCRTGDW